MKNAYELFTEGERTEIRSFYWTLFFILNMVILLVFRNLTHDYINMHQFRNQILIIVYIMLPVYGSMYTITEGRWIKAQAWRNYGSNTEEHF